MGIKADLQFTGFDRLRRMLNPIKFERALKRRVKEQNEKLSKITVDALDKSIESEGVQNRPLTKILKHSHKPLIEEGEMFGSVGSKLKGFYQFTTGVKRIGSKGQNVAAILHEGAIVPVSEGMRSYFRAMAAEFSPLVKPLKASTSQIVIKPRPFMKRAFFDNDVLTNRILFGWRDAVHMAFADLARGRK
jgi:hypothetical protein